MTPAKLLQPRHFDGFRCIGADCEDTCCVGWLIQVDKRTYEKYQDFTDAQRSSPLRTLVTINEKRSNDADYARIALNGITCPFLSDGLCSIQLQLGEDYLPDMCATFPRVINRVDDVLQRSLDLACPEAARVVLLDPGPIEFDERPYQDGSVRLADFASLDMSRLRQAPDPYVFFREVRRLTLSLLQDRSYPVWKRLYALGCFCERLDQIGIAGWDERALQRLREFIENFTAGAGEDPWAGCQANPTTRLEIVLELIVARIRSDSNPRSFLNCYKEFMDGIQWTSKSTMDEIGDRYAAAYAQDYFPFMGAHEHIIENYLVNYAYRTLLPLGIPESDRRLAADSVTSCTPSCIASQYMLMVAHYAIVQTLLIGMAGFHKSAFGAPHILKLIQSCTKTFEHSTTFPALAIQMLSARAMTKPSNLCVLIRN